EILSNYTLSKATDDGEGFNTIGGGLFLGSDGVLDPFHRDYNPANNMPGEQGLSGGDNRHRFTSSVIWAPNFGKDSSNKVMKGALGGWALSGTVTATSSTRYSGTVQSSSVQSICPGTGVLPNCGTSPSSAKSGLDGGMTAALLSTGGTPIGGRI